ncbi:hypothetical protein MBCUT_16790 [Methanobrevibacter cuticularis]|uniref:Uncharacterized protein n=1 Tax=Methanobrevibacter cuticularis TaxID=47311 RepID=A0A166D566_9EURY|nr:hypothetical protein [Methanobrevibacter cuticularis]KZX15219.1 hypothetical protein MBCUT_16790 [Methanobrevibacter cuticularis]
MGGYETDDEGYSIEKAFGPQKETIKNKNGSKIEISYHLLPTCHDEKGHLAHKYKAYFMKTKYYNKDGELINEEKGLNPNADKIHKERLDFYNELGEKDEEMRKMGEMHYMTGVKFGFYTF